MSRFSLKRGSASAPESNSAPNGAGRTTSEASDVNLIPQLVRNSIAVRRIRKIFIWVGAVVVAAIAAVWLMQSASIMAAQSRIDQARLQAEELGAKVTALAPIGQLYALLDDQEGFLNGALTSQVRTADVLDAIKADAGKRVTFSNLAVTVTGIPQPNAQASDIPACPDADPFTTEIIVGCISFTAQGRDREDVSTFLEMADANPFFVDPYVTTTSIGETGGGQPQVTFSGSTGLSLDALVSPPTTEERDALLQALVQAEQQAANPSPEATSSASPSAAVSQ